MPIPILVWIVAAGVAGFAAGYFWDDVIKPWAIRAAGKILDFIDKAFEYFSEGVVYLLEKGGEYIKQLKVYTKTKEGKYMSRVVEEEINASEVPDDIRANLDAQEKQEVGRIKIDNDKK